MRTLCFVLLCLCTISDANAARKKIAYSDIEGTWIYVGPNVRSIKAPAHDACNGFARKGDDWQIGEETGIFIKGRRLSGYEFSCYIDSGVIRRGESIVLRTSCGIQGDQMHRTYSFSRFGDLLVADVRETSMARPRKKPTRFTEVYQRIDCAPQIRQQNIGQETKSKLRCDWTAASFRSSAHEGMYTEVQFSAIDSPDGVTLRSFGRDGALEWTHQAQFTCGNGIALCWLIHPRASGANASDEDDSAPTTEIIPVNIAADDTDRGQATIIVLAGIPLLFRGPIEGITVDIKFADPFGALNRTGYIYVPEIYYFHRCN
ncbi:MULTISPECIES: hypothetical protein [Rhodomicrobium]|uniref:hypothetical protein n=1 Tax=Rhodomicrobium TaxID=1068 RepID=UPI000F748CEC|nr:MULTISPECIES: hypothetical protein [Rhodomicrobium]